MKQFSKNEKHASKWSQKYPKMALNRGKNDVKNSVVTIIVIPVKTISPKIPQNSSQHRGK